LNNNDLQDDVPIKYILFNELGVVLRSLLRILNH
jgi:hypothetical protein